MVSAASRFSTATPTWSIADSMRPRRIRDACRRLSEDLLQARVGRVATPHLRARPAVEQNHVGGEVVLATDQGGPDAVGVDRNSRCFELPDPARREAAAGHDLDIREAVAVQCASN